MGFLDAIADESSRALIAEMSEPASWTPAGGQSRTVEAIYDRETEVVEVGELVETQAVVARATVSAASVPGVGLGDLFTIRNADYRIVLVEDDGWGNVTLTLAL